LEKPREEIKGLFPKRTGKVHLMGCIPVEEKGVEEKRKKPMDKKECQDNRHGYNCRCKLWHYAITVCQMIAKSWPSQPLWEIVGNGINSRTA
jgi:hypothetical protein